MCFSSSRTIEVQSSMTEDERGLGHVATIGRERFDSFRGSKSFVNVVPGTGTGTGSRILFNAVQKTKM